MMFVAFSLLRPMEMPPASLAGALHNILYCSASCYCLAMELEWLKSQYLASLWQSFSISFSAKLSLSPAVSMMQSQDQTRITPEFIENGILLIDWVWPVV